MSKVTQTVTVTDVRKQLQSIGDKVNDTFEKTEDINVALVAIKAYNGAINAAKTQLIYKKASGMPAKIPFLEK